MKYFSKLEKLNEVLNLSATSILKKIKKKDIDIEYLVDIFVKQILKFNKNYLAFKFFDKELIYKQIEELKKKNINNCTMFSLPIGVKDIFNTISMPTTHGSEIYKNFNAGNDARVVFDLKENGALIFGKTYSSEFAVHHPTPTKNPWGDNLSPGTSSAGSAVAVATRMVPISLGSQTAGSIMRPASYCGVIGYKPTFGLIARTGVLKTADTLDTIGFFANYIEDLELILSTVRQKGINYPIINSKIDKKKIVYKNKFKIAVIEGPKTKNADKNILYNFEDFIKQKNNSRFIFKKIKLSNIFETAHYFHNIIYSKSLSYYLKKEFSSNPNKFSKSLNEIIIFGKKITLKDYFSALDYQKKLIKIVDNIFRDYDFIIDLSTFSSAPLYNRNGIEDHNLIWTMSHIPSISLPILNCAKNFPVGIQVSSRRYNDYQLLDFAKKIYEK